MDQTQKPISQRLTEKIKWYKDHAGKNLRLFKGLKALQIVISAGLPIIALLKPSQLTENHIVILSGIIGAVLVTIEGFQQLGQYQQDWIRYRNAQQAIEREIALYNADAGEYAGAKSSSSLLTERTEAIIAIESTVWTEDQRRIGQSQNG